MDSLDVTGAERRRMLVRRTDGLGSRMLNLAWGWRAARRLGARTIVCWPGTPGGNVAQFGAGYRSLKLFDLLEIYGRDDTDLIFIDGDLPVIGDERRIDLRPGWKRQGARGWAPGDVFGEASSAVYIVCDPLLLKGETLAQAREEARELLGRLTPAQPIRKRLDQIDGALDLTRMTGVHVRRGDIAAQLALYGEHLRQDATAAPADMDTWTDHYFTRCAPPRAYVSALDSLGDAAAEVVIFSEDADAVETLTRLAPERRFISLAPYLAGLPPVQAAMVEMRAMARCGRIVSTGSRFGEAASLIGGVDLVDARRFATQEDCLDDLFGLMNLTRRGQDDPAARVTLTSVRASRAYFRLCRRSRWAADAHEKDEPVVAG